MNTKKALVINLALAGAIVSSFFLFRWPPFLISPICIFSGLHFLVLEMLCRRMRIKILHEQLCIVFYGLIGALSVISVLSLLFFVYEFNFMGFLRSFYALIGLLVLTPALITTITLLIFSHFFFKRSIKEVWKPVLLAGIIAVVGSFIATSAFLKWFFGNSPLLLQPILAYLAQLIALKNKNTSICSVNMLLNIEVFQMHRFHYRVEH